MRINPNLFTEGPIGSPTLNVMGLALAFLSPGLFLAGIVEWVSPTSHNEWPLFASAAISLNVGLTLRALSEISDEVKPLSMFSMVAWSWVACSFMGHCRTCGEGILLGNFDGALSNLYPVLYFRVNGIGRYRAREACSFGDNLPNGTAVWE